jgi:hypothetical protein
MQIKGSTYAIFGTHQPRLHVEMKSQMNISRQSTKQVA